jgi:hypothetical protein
MGFLIRVDGISVPCDQLLGVVQYEDILNDILDERRSDSYRIRCINAISGCGMPTQKFFDTLNRLTEDTRSDIIRGAANDAILRHRMPQGIFCC